MYHCVTSVFQLGLRRFRPGLQPTRSCDNPKPFADLAMSTRMQVLCLIILSYC
jgi:hypothetical protein